MTAPRRALIVIDAQQEYFEGLLKIQYPPRDSSLARITEAVDAARAAGTPVVLVQHRIPGGSPVFAPGSPTYELHPDLAERAEKADKLVVKEYSSVFADTGLADWLRERGVDTVAFTGYMTNNCVLASVAETEPLGLTAEVLSDATGAIDIANAAGRADARRVHETLMAVFHSNLAAVTTTRQWLDALEAGAVLDRGNLVESAAEGRAIG